MNHLLRDSFGPIPHAIGSSHVSHTPPPRYSDKFFARVIILSTMTTTTTTTTSSSGEGEEQGRVTRSCAQGQCQGHRQQHARLTATSIKALWEYRDWRAACLHCHCGEVNWWHSVEFRFVNNSLVERQKGSTTSHLHT